MINGIDLPSSRPDFLDRCLVFHCKRMEVFKPLQELNAAFERARPRLLGALLDLLSKTMQVLPTTPSATDFRMADFAQFGRAVTQALGRPVEEFDKAYRLNLDHQSRELVVDSLFAQAVSKFALGFREGDAWTGSTQDLLKGILKTAKDNGLSHKDKSWPGSPRWASSQLRELAPALGANGVIVEQLKRATNCRPWKVYCRESSPLNGSPESPQK
ncbi:MAG: hypothetical protein KatS3mg105_4955 [Gemmatales bacterium]|nr:MAG: hypothetical protein KatS3mg105_4955 [Gemmatales bacterium]